MNERIRELAEQARINLSPFQFSGTPIKYEVSDFELEKFAELIVEECAKSANDWYQNHNKIHSDPMSYVLAHFGVEE